ncbi:putative ferric-chelate reductase 1 [Eleutherodactylus coqui]|uniref:putative ferric-chelate reductase 1 n=1 Tax=Eleutherodactylus coqui TaxID=57060 RepID=UPI003461B245
MILCGCFPSFSIGNLQHAEDKMYSLKYQKSLGEKVMPSMKVYVFGFLILGFLASHISTHSNGLVHKACDTMMPEHGTTVPQTTEPPYRVSASSYSYRPADKITVTLQANPGTYFEGFLLQARSLPGNEIVGHFIVTDPKSQNLICGENVNSTVTHTDSSKKSIISTIWVAPASVSSVIFKATIVESKHTFWVGVASPKLTGEDDIQICVINSNKQEEIQHDYTEGRASPLMLPLSNVDAKKISFAGDVIKCFFTSRNQISTLLPELQGRSSNDSDTYYIMSHGPADNESIRFHGPSVFFNDTKKDLTSNVTHKGNNKHIMVKVHGALMLIAWMTTGSLGMIIARYFKTAASRPILGKALWFQAHQVLMILTVAAVIVSFVLSFVVAEGWAYDVSTHAILGCIVMILAFFQPLFAFFRPLPQTNVRYIFNWYHAISALVMTVLSVANLFLGFQFIDHRLGWMVKVMGGFVGWEALAIILLEINADLAKKAQPVGKQTAAANDSSAIVAELCHWLQQKPVKLWVLVVACILSSSALLVETKYTSTEVPNRASSIDMNLVRFEVYLLHIYLCGNLAFLIALLVGIGLS